MRPVQQSVDDGAEPHACVAAPASTAHDDGQGMLGRTGQLLHRVSGRHLMGQMYVRSREELSVISPAATG